jgi:hypothetical protein
VSAIHAGSIDAAFSCCGRVHDPPPFDDVASFTSTTKQPYDGSHVVDGISEWNRSASRAVEPDVAGSTAIAGRK